MLELVTVRESLNLLCEVILSLRDKDFIDYHEEGYGRFTEDDYVLFDNCALLANEEIETYKLSIIKGILSYDVYPQKKNRNWSDVETFNLLEGMRKYGKNEEKKWRWTEIAANYLYGYYRTPDQCKVRFRACPNLKKEGGLYEKYLEVCSLEAPVTEGLEPPVLGRTEYVRIFLQNVEEFPAAHLDRLLHFMVSAEMDGFLVSARSAIAVEVLTEVLGELRRVKFPHNVELQADIASLNSLKGSLSKATRVAREPLLKSSAKLYFAPTNQFEGNTGGEIDAGTTQREGLMLFKRFVMGLEDDILPTEAVRRYEEYKSKYISTQKRLFFDAHKDEEWLKDKYHPTNLVTVIERRNELARKAAKEFVLDLQNWMLDLGPGVDALPPNKTGHTTSNPNYEERDDGGKRKRNGRGPGKESDVLYAAPRAHPISSDPRRIQIDVEQAQALVRKLDSEKGVEDNFLAGSDSDKTNIEKSHGSSTGPVIIIRGAASVKGLEGIELLDTLLTYLWWIHGLDYYGMLETSEPEGLRHIRGEGKTSDTGSGGPEWEKKIDSRWQERLRGQDPLEIMTAKEKIDAATVEFLDPYVRKIRDKKRGWKYGCGVEGCTKEFRGAEFVHKHLKLMHTEVISELTSEVNKLYFQNYMNDPNAPGGIPVCATASTGNEAP